MKKTMHRRLFLQGAGGAVVAAPFLSTLGIKPAIGQTAANPTRIITYFTHYGCITDKWFPAKAHGELTPEDLEGTSIKALKDHYAKLLIPRGIRGINEWTFGREFGQETDPHSQVMASYMTLQPVDRTSSGQTIGGGLNFDKLNALAYGRSWDHVVAEQLNPSGVGPLVAHIGGARTDSISNMSYSASQEIYPGVGSPAQLYSALTNLGKDTGGGAMNPDTYKVVTRQKTAVDIVRDDIQRLQSQQMSQADREKLAQWMELLQSTSGAVSSALCTDAVAAELGIVSGGGNPGNSLPAVTAVMMDLAVMNALCDQSRIIMLMMPSAGSFTFLDGVSGDIHGLSHRIGNANMGGTCTAGVLGMLEKIDIFYAEQFAYLVGKLDSVQDGEGTLLDNTAAVWWQEQSDGQAHNNNNMPIIQAGSCGGYFKTGWAINVEDGSPEMSRGNSLGQCGDGDSQIGSNEVQSTGTDNAVANATIAKYYYALMNAVGVKANADGFPDMAGSEKVSKYGWSDDPEKYAAFVPENGDGLTKYEGGFVDPGEFEDLLA